MGMTHTAAAIGRIKSDTTRRLEAELQDRGWGWKITVHDPCFGNLGSMWFPTKTRAELAVNALGASISGITVIFEAPR
jgi:hypothetical protein